MLWLVISSLLMGVSQVPTGASFAAMSIVDDRMRGALATDEEYDLQIANSAIHISHNPYPSYRLHYLQVVFHVQGRVLTFAFGDSAHRES